MDRDSPVEWTGRAHLVSVSCPTCGETHSVSETVAHEQDGDVLCNVCYDAMEDLWCDLYIRDQVNRLRILADYMEHNGFHVKSQMLTAFAQDLQKYEPVIRAIEQVRDNGKLTRQRLEEQIQRYDEA